MAIAGIELCFGYCNNDELHGKIDCMGDLYGQRAIAAAILSIVVEDWHGGKWSSWCCHTSRHITGIPSYH